MLSPITIASIFIVIFLIWKINHSKKRPISKQNVAEQVKPSQPGIGFKNDLTIKNRLAPQYQRNPPALERVEKNNYFNEVRAGEQRTNLLLNGMPEDPRQTARFFQPENARNSDLAPAIHTSNNINNKATPCFGNWAVPETYTGPNNLIKESKAEEDAVSIKELEFHRGKEGKIEIETPKKSAADYASLKNIQSPDSAFKIYESPASQKYKKDANKEKNKKMDKHLKEKAKESLNKNERKLNKSRSRSSSPKENINTEAARKNEKVKPSFKVLSEEPDFQDEHDILEKPIYPVKTNNGLFPNTRNNMGNQDRKTNKMVVEKTPKAILKGFMKGYVDAEREKEEYEAFPKGLSSIQLFKKQFIQERTVRNPAIKQIYNLNKYALNSTIREFIPTTQQEEKVVKATVTTTQQEEKVREAAAETIQPKADSPKKLELFKTLTDTSGLPTLSTTKLNLQSKPAENLFSKKESPTKNTGKNEVAKNGSPKKESPKKDIPKSDNNITEISKKENEKKEENSLKVPSLFGNFANFSQTPNNLFQNLKSNTEPTSTVLSLNLKSNEPISTGLFQNLKSSNEPTATNLPQNTKNNEATSTGLFQKGTEPTSLGLFQKSIDSTSTGLFQNPKSTEPNSLGLFQKNIETTSTGLFQISKGNEPISTGFFQNLKSNEPAKEKEAPIGVELKRADDTKVGVSDEKKKEPETISLFGLNQGKASFPQQGLLFTRENESANTSEPKKGILTSNLSFGKNEKEEKGSEETQKALLISKDTEKSPSNTSNLIKSNSLFGGLLPNTSNANTSSKSLENNKAEDKYPVQGLFPSFTKLNNPISNNNLTENDPSKKNLTPSLFTINQTSNQGLPPPSLFSMTRAPSLAKADVSKERSSAPLSLFTNPKPTEVSGKSFFNNLSTQNSATTNNRSNVPPPSTLFFNYPNK